jgi:hypothetical protein
MRVFFLFLLVAGPFFVCAQGRLTPVLPAPGFPQLNEGPLRLLVPDLRVGDTVMRRSLLLSGPAMVVKMAPDRMPCVVPDLLRVERMPVDRRGNADRMPNRVRP